MAARRGNSKRLSDDPEKGRGRALVVVLLVQVVVAAVFILLVATHSLPIPGADQAPKTSSTSKVVR
jgi:hypothetical protein